MPLDAGVTTALSAVSGALATSIKITEKVYEIIAVGEQSRSLLTTINQVNQQLETAKTLRRQKSGVLSTSEKETIEQTFASTEEALDHVARLVEKTRVDQQIHGGKVGFRSRMHFVLRDSPNIMMSLAQLGIANQQLIMAVMMLHLNQSPRIIVAQDNATLTPNPGLERKSPPGYEESQMIASIRQRNLRKRASALGVDAVGVAMDSISKEHHLHQSPSTLSLPAELAGDRPGGRKDSVFEMDSDRLSTTSTLVDDGLSDRSPHAQQGVSTTSGLGRARSRRWMEAHCS